MKKKFRYPLIKNNILKDDLSRVIKYLKKKDPVLTQSKFTRQFEQKWSKWLGTKYSVFVNSGSSANLISMSLLKLKYPKGGEVIVPPLTWSSDISSIIHCGFKPVFVDIKLKNLAMDEDLILKKINKKTKAVFLTYVQGFNGLSDRLLKFLKIKNIDLIEDVCESHGAKFKGRKLGTFGWTSNFSFYYAHHMSTIEGGMVCTSCYKTYNNILMLRSHGMLREIEDKSIQNKIYNKNRNLNKDFIFELPGYNLRNNEIGAIIGINQLKRLNNNIKKRNLNHRYFLKNLNKNFFFTEFDLTGSSNYAFNLILKIKNKKIMKKLVLELRKNGVEFRLGSAGGGNQIRQPYVRNIFKTIRHNNFKITDHIHFFGMYIGNYPDLKKTDIKNITNIINAAVEKF